MHFLAFESRFDPERQQDALRRGITLPLLAPGLVATGIFAFHRVVWNMARGVYGKFQYDYGDNNTLYKDDHKHRVTLGVNVHPYTYIDIEADYRLNYGPVSPFTRLLDANVNEFLLMTHIWF